jgi:hypothetical protein
MPPKLQPTPVGRRCARLAERRQPGRNVPPAEYRLQEGININLTGALASIFIFPSGKPAGLNLSNPGASLMFYFTPVERPGSNCEEKIFDRIYRMNRIFDGKPCQDAEWS